MNMPLQTTRRSTRLTHSRSAAAMILAAGTLLTSPALAQQGTPAPGGTPSQAPRPRPDAPPSPSQGDAPDGPAQPPADPGQNDPNNNDPRNNDPSNQPRPLDRDGNLLDRRDNDNNRNDPNTPANRNSSPFFAFAGADAQVRLAQTVSRLAAIEQDLQRRNDDLLRRLGDARQFRGEQRIDALAALFQEMLLEQRRTLEYLAETRAALTGSGSLSEQADRQNGQPASDRNDPAIQDANLRDRPQRDPDGNDRDNNNNDTPRPDNDTPRPDNDTPRPDNDTPRPNNAPDAPDRPDSDTPD